jgi:hypothetical protein
MGRRIILVSLIWSSVICFLKENQNQVNKYKKNDNLKKMFKSKIQWTSGLGYPQAATPIYVCSHSHWVSIKSFIDLRSRLSILAYKMKLLLVKHFHIIQQFKKIYHIKQNLIICFACEMNRIDPLECVVMEPWISLIQFFEPDYDCLKKWSDITC